MMFPYGEQVILHREVLQDEPDPDGNDVYTDTAAALEGCAYWPSGSVELVEGRETVTDTPTVAIPRESLPPGITSILATDEITARGVRMSVKGKPADYGSNPFTGRQVPITVRLQDVTG